MPSGPESEIVIVGTNGGQGPNLAGLWMQGQLRFADGSVQTLKSDPSWLWNSAVPNPDGLFTPDPGHWKPAVEVNGAAWQRINDALQGLIMENANGGGPLFAGQVEGYEKLHHGIEGVDSLPGP